MRSPRAWYIFAGIVVAGLFVQLFLRYDYVHLAGGRVMRIDRLAATSCYLPCVPTPPPTEAPIPTPAPTRTPIPYDIMDAHIIDRMISVTPPNYPPTSLGYAWRIVAYFTTSGSRFYGKQLDPWKYRVRIACYCNAKQLGYFWEVTPESPYSFEFTTLNITLRVNMR